MSFETAGGTCYAVSAARPVTLDKAGFAALTFTAIGEPETAPDLTESYQAATFTNICTGKTSTKKGSQEAITLELTCARDDDDAGQVIMNAGLHDKADHAFRITEQDADGADVITYFLGNIMSGTRRYGSNPNEVKRRQYRIGVTAPATGDTFVDGT